MALSKDEIDAINQLMQTNNANLLAQVKTMINNSTAQPAAAPTVVNNPVYPQQMTTPAYQVPCQPSYGGNQQLPPGALAYAIANAINGQYNCMNQFSNLTMNDIMMYPPNVRDAIIQNMTTPSVSPEVQQLSDKVDDLTNLVQYQTYANQHRHHKRHTALKIGAGVVAGGALVYGVHKLKHRHDNKITVADLKGLLGNTYSDIPDV